MHHEQDIRKMGGLRKYMPITYWTAAIGTLALIGFPGTSGFFSKDALIEAVKDSHWQETDQLVYWIAYLSVLLGVFVTALYSFRMFFLVFHGEERMDKETKSHLHETSWVVTGPLILLAIPSAIIGWFTIEPVLFGGFFGDSIQVLGQHDVLSHLGETFHDSAAFVTHAMQGPAVYLAAAGVLTAWFLYLVRPDIPEKISQKLSGLYTLLDRKYYFDDLWIKGFAAGGRNIGQFLSTKGDELVIDGMIVNGTAKTIEKFAGVLRRVQSGYLYHYAFAMFFGVTIILAWLLWA